jgi:hypothetical protein
MTDHQMGGTTPYPPALGTVLQRRDNVRVVGEAKVIVVTERQERLPIDHHFRPLRAFQQGPLAIKSLLAALSETSVQVERHDQAEAAS